MKAILNDAKLLRYKLHDFIEHADVSHLAEIYKLVDGKMPHKAYAYDDRTMDMLHERRDAHQNGVSRSYTKDESVDTIRKRNF